MRRSLPLALALAALTVVGVCRTASAVMNNPNPSTPAPKAIIKTKAKPPAGPTAATASAVTTPNAATATSKASRLKTSNPAALTSSNLTTASPPPPKTPPKPLTPADLKNDITQMQDTLKRMQQLEAGASDAVKNGLAQNQYRWDPTNPRQMKCPANGNCVAFFPVQLADLTAVVAGNGIQKTITRIFEVPVDRRGVPIQGAQEVLAAAMTALYANQASFVKERIAADYFAMNGTGGDNIDIPRANTALRPL